MFGPALFQLFGEPGHDLVEVRVVDLDQFVRHDRKQLLKIVALGETGRRAVQHDEPDLPPGILHRQRQQRERQQRERAFLALADDEQVVAALPAENQFGRTLDGIGRAQPDARLVGETGGHGGHGGAQQQILPDVRRGAAFKDDWPGILAGRLIGMGPDFGQVTVADLVIQPHGLERTVALNRTGGVVVNPLAGTGQQARRRVVLVHDQISVSLVALERDADDHLPDRGARQRISAAERLRPQQHVDAERAPLPHDAVQQHRRPLRDAVLLHKKFLELVNQQQRTRQRFAAARAVITGEILRPALPEQIAAPAQFLVHPLQHAQPERPVALNRHHPRMGQPAAGITLELDALLKVHQIKFHLLGAAPQGQVRDHDMEQRGFARARLARDQRMLARALADGQILPFRRPGTPDGHAKFLHRAFLPERIIRRRDLLEGHFHPGRIFAALAGLVQETRGKLRRRRRLEHDLHARHGLVADLEPLRRGRQADTGFFQVIQQQISRQRRALIPLDEHINAAAGAAGGDVPQPAGRRVAEIDGERGDDQKMILFRQGARLRVILRNGRVIIAQIHLDDFFHVLVQIRELFLELRRLSPDAAVDGAFLVIRQVHQGREIFPETDRIKNGEAQFPRRRRGQQPENQIIDRGNRLGRAGQTRLKEQRTLLRIRQQEGERQRRRQGRPAGKRQARVFGQNLGKRFQSDLQPPHPGRIRERRGGLPRVPPGRLPRREQPLRRRDAGAHGLVPRFHENQPIPLQRLPARFMPQLEFRHGGLVRFGQLPDLRLGFQPQRRQCVGKPRFDAHQTVAPLPLALLGRPPGFVVHGPRQTRPLGGQLPRFLLPALIQGADGVFAFLLPAQLFRLMPRFGFFRRGGQPLPGGGQVTGDFPGGRPGRVPAIPVKNPQQHQRAQADLRRGRRQQSGVEMLQPHRHRRQNQEQDAAQPERHPGEQPGGGLAGEALQFPGQNLAGEPL